MRLSTGAIDRVPRPRPDVSFFATRGGAVLLNGVDGWLCALDPASALCWLSLDAPDPRAEATTALRDLAGFTSETADTWYADAVGQFADAGLLAGTSPPESPPPVALPSPRSGPPPAPPTDTLTLFGQLAALAFALTVPRGLAPLATGMLSPMLTARPAPEALSLTLHAMDDVFVLATPERVLGETAPGVDAAVALEMLLIDLAVRHTPHLTMLHAALLGRGGSGVLITGVSGAGKTTLSATLAASGWRYGGDERVLLSTDAATIIPLPTSPCVKPGALASLTHLFPALDTVPEHPRAGRRIRYLALPAGDATPMTVRTVVFPERAAGASPSVEEIAPLDGLRRLMEQCLRVPRGFGAAETERLLAWHDGLTYVRLRYDEAASAVPLLERLLRAT
jgi:hypothetical protein